MVADLMEEWINIADVDGKVQITLQGIVHRLTNLPQASMLHQSRTLDPLKILSSF